MLQKLRNNFLTVFKENSYRVAEQLHMAFFRKDIRLLGQAVKTSPFHGGNTGSIPVGVTRK